MTEVTKKVHLDLTQNCSGGCPPKVAPRRLPPEGCPPKVAPQGCPPKVAQRFPIVVINDFHKSYFFVFHSDSLTFQIVSCEVIGRTNMISFSVEVNDRTDFQVSPMPKVI